MTLRDLTEEERSQILLISEVFKVPYYELLEYPYTDFEYMLEYAQSKSINAINDVHGVNNQLTVIKSNSKLKDKEEINFLVNSRLMLSKEVKKEMIESLMRYKLFLKVDSF